MARRREYVSFFDSPRRKRGETLFADRRRGLSPRFVGVSLVIGLVAASVWWFVIRDTGETRSAEGRILGDTTVPTLLLPSGGTSLPETGVSLIDTACAADDAAGDWQTFQGSNAHLGCISARTISNPEILWTFEVGIQGWLNNPVIADGTVFVGSAGVSQFATDRRDGVWAVDIATGERVWYFGTTLDVNGVGYSDGVVVATGDEGLVWGIDATDSSELWTDDLNVGVFTNPLMIGDLAIVGDGNGVLTAYDTPTGTRVWQVPMQGPIRGGAASDGTIIVAASETGQVTAMTLEGTALWTAQVRSRMLNDQARIFATPTLTEDLVVLSIVRDDVFAEPGVVALDKQTGSIAWQATDSAGVKPEWGNVRSSPAIAGDLLVYGEAYSSAIVAIDATTGRTVWSTDVGEFCFPAWSSPVVVGSQAVLPRFDGGLYGVDLNTQEEQWGVYLGDVAADGAFPEDFVPGFCEWQPTSGASILATPAVSEDGIIVVGTLQGFLVAIGDSDWD